LNKTVSIIIPCRNEAEYIEKCVVSILNCNYPQELLSIYVCDGLSDDNTRNIISTIAKSNTNVHLIDNQKKSTPYGLNLGLKKCNASIKIILSAHATIHSDFIAENLNSLSLDKKIGCTGGVIENVYENETAEIIGLAMSSPFGVGNAHFRTGKKDGYVDTVAFGAYKKEIFDQIGYFDEDLDRNQDDEFNFRLLKNGFKIYLSSNIKSKYYVRGAYTKLFKQYYQYGYWKVFVNKKHKTITTARQLVPLFFVLFLFAGPLIGLIDIRLLILWCFIGIIYDVSALFFALKTTTQTSKAIKVAFTFLILHFSYGIGYLRGLVNFIIFGKSPSNKNATLSR